MNSFKTSLNVEQLDERELPATGLLGNLGTLPGNLSPVIRADLIQLREAQQQLQEDRVALAPILRQDRIELAHQLAEIANQFTAHVNLIPYNPIPGPNWRPSTREQVMAFMRTLEDLGVRTSVRGPRGRDIAAACGQLRAEHEMVAPKPYVKFVELTTRKAY